MKPSSVKILVGFLSQTFVFQKQQNKEPYLSQFKPLDVQI